MLQDDARPRDQRYEKGDRALEKAYEARGVIVARAPKGMSRNKVNATKLSVKTRILRWTVEWVQPDGTRTVGVCPETQPVFQAYAAHLNWINPGRSNKRRKPIAEVMGKSMPNGEASQGPLEPPMLEDSAATGLPNDSGPIDPHVNDCQLQVADGSALTKSQIRKRRRKGQIDRATSAPKAQVDLDAEQQLQEWIGGIARKRQAEEKHLEHAIEAADEREWLETNQKGELEDSEKSQFGQGLLEKMGLQEGDDMGGSSQQRAANTATPVVDAITVDLEQKVTNGFGSEKPASSTPQPASNDKVAFYLHHPSLPSRQPVLIPLSPHSKLATSLTNRLVLEFPTIYVLNQQPDEKLPEGFISEHDFFQLAKKGLVEELEDGEVNDAGRDEVKGDQQGGGREGVDEKRLLEVLGRDLNGVAGAL